MKLHYYSNGSSLVSFLQSATAAIKLNEIQEKCDLKVDLFCRRSPAGIYINWTKQLVPVYTKVKKKRQSRLFGAFLDLKEIQFSILSPRCHPFFIGRKKKLWVLKKQKTKKNPRMHSTIAATSAVTHLPSVPRLNNKYISRNDILLEEQPPIRQDESRQKYKRNDAQTNLAGPTC